MSDLMKGFWYRLETLKQLFPSFKGAFYLYIPTKKRILVIF